MNPVRRWLLRRLLPRELLLIPANATDSMTVNNAYELASTLTEDGQPITRGYLVVERERYSATNRPQPHGRIDWP